MDSSAWQWDVIHSLAIIAGLALMAVVVMAASARPRISAWIPAAIAATAAVLWVASQIYAA